MVYIGTLFAMFLLMRIARYRRASARRRRPDGVALGVRPIAGALSAVFRLSAAKAASGALSISLSSARAGPRG